MAPKSKRARALLLASALCAIAAIASSGAHAAANFVIVNTNAAGVGFNDATPAAPVGGNNGTTVGAQRLNAFQFAAGIWGSQLTSIVPIQVRASFTPLACTATSAVLGSAGPLNSFRDFTGATIPNTWYVIALANSLAGLDLDPPGDDISATFSSTIGTTDCLQTSGWYYGLDHNPPSNRIDFVSVLLHELGHGIGILSLVDLATGAKATGGRDDTYMRNLEDHGASPPGYPAMTNAQRVAASIDSGNLHWIGANVRAASCVLTAGTVGDHVRMFAPNPQQPGSSVSHWDTVLTPDQIMEPSYTGAHHQPVMELALLKDIGWQMGATPTCLSPARLSPALMMFLLD